MDDGMFFRRLSRIDRKGYGRARELVGSYEFPSFRLNILSVPKDPYLLPGRMKITFPAKNLSYPDNIARHGVLAAHFINKEMSELNGRNLKIYRPTNIVIERSSCIFGKKVSLSFDFYVPFRGRKIDAAGMKDLIWSVKEKIDSLGWKSLGERRNVLKKMAMVYEDQLEIRKRIGKENIAVFVANGSVLPRARFGRGKMENAVPFVCNEPVEIEGRHGTYEGLAIEKNRFTVIAGSNFQGKSTLLDAIAVSFYNHEYGDGREFVIGEEMALSNKENGRIVNCTSMRPFMDNERFSTQRASGSVSQMANVAEAVKAGKGLLIDEDESAVNFLLSPAIGEKTTTPFIDAIPEGTVIMVSSALKEFIDKAERLVVMENFTATKTSRRGSAKRERYEKWKCAEKIGKSRISRVEKYRIFTGGKHIDLSGPIAKTIYERAQTYLLADLIRIAMGMEGDRWEMAGRLFSMLKDRGFGITGREGNYTMVTRYQIYYALNRYPFMKARNPGG